MTYDNYGNILTKNGKVYTYGDDVWKDKLTAIGEDTISYDAQGNPVNYLGHTLTWEKGRQLKSFDGNTYTYNANGIRTSKTVNGVKHTYTLDGTKILRETWDDTEIIPLYDNEDSVCGLYYEGLGFYFLKNLQGDIIAITDEYGKTVAKYSYDAWGKCTIVEDTSNCNIATLNPYRYRGYYYDAEIGMYYLQSRYYAPEIGRFINVDEVCGYGVLDKLNTLCLYTYCENDPANKEDHTGFATVFVAGYGLQIELNSGWRTYGVELVWYIVSSIRKGRSWYIPYVYLYGGGGLSSDLTSLISKITKDPSLMFNPKKMTKASASVSIFAIFGYSGKFTSPEDYEGLFSGVSATVWHVKAYTAYCSTCFAVGVGVSTSKFSASSGGTYYALSSKVFEGLSKVYDKVAKKAKTIKK